VDPFQNGGITRISLRGVNRPRGPDGIVAYTRRWGPRTPGSSGRELVLRAASDPRLAVGSQTVFEATGIRNAGGYISDDEIALSGNGDGAWDLEQLWARIAKGEVNPVVSLDIGSGPETLIGTRPLLVRDGSILPHSRSSFARTRHPRSIVASRADGTILLVVIDGRHRHRRGMSLIDAARFMRSLGAVDAANLDGGGSSALVVGGRLHSRPSGHERQVATALVVVPRAPVT
jgi:hypothetical protein